jgi:hypothetical protein
MQAGVLQSTRATWETLLAAPALSAGSNNLRTFKQDKAAPQRF